VTGLPLRTAKRLKAGHTPRRGTVTAALARLRADGLSLAGALDLAQRAPGGCAHPGCTEPVRQFGARCPEHQRERNRLRMRRDRAAPTRGVPCVCGQTMGFGTLKAGWRGECCPSGRQRAAISECPGCGALLLGGAVDEAACLVCGTPRRAEEAAR